MGLRRERSAGLTEWVYPTTQGAQAGEFAVDPGTDVNVRQMVKKIEQATEPKFVRPKTQAPRVRAEPAQQIPGLGSASLHQPHIWALSVSSYTAAHVSSARLEFNNNRKDPTTVWVGISFDEQIVYKLGDGQSRRPFRHAVMRDTILARYSETVGTLGVRVGCTGT